jgi:peptidoglycan hydrolase-like protein with peptidoglycan-binding domain
MLGDLVRIASETPLPSTVRRGSSGADVKKLQTLLNAAGFNAGVVDGSFGSGTDAAVRKFQQSKGLTADGIVGPMSWKTLMSIAPKEVLAKPVFQTMVNRTVVPMTTATGGSISQQTGSGFTSYDSSKNIINKVKGFVMDNRLASIVVGAGLFGILAITFIGESSAPVKVAANN